MRDQCASILVISDGSRTSHKREEGGHPDPEIGGGGLLVSKNFSALQDQFGLKGAGAGSRASSLDPPLVIALVTSN